MHELCFGTALRPEAAQYLCIAGVCPEVTRPMPMYELCFGTALRPEAAQYLCIAGVCPEAKG